MAVDEEQIALARVAAEDLASMFAAFARELASLDPTAREAAHQTFAPMIFAARRATEGHRAGGADPRIAFFGLIKEYTLALAATDEQISQDALIAFRRAAVDMNGAAAMIQKHFALQYPDLAPRATIELIDRALDAQTEHPRGRPRTGEVRQQSKADVEAEVWQAIADTALGARTISRKSQRNQRKKNTPKKGR